MNALASGLQTVGDIGSSALGGGLVGKVTGKWKSFSKTASGFKIGQKGSKLYAGLSSGLS